MKLKKIFLMVLVCVITIATMLPLSSFATDAGEGQHRWYGITKIRVRENEGLGYSIRNHNDGGQALWNIVRYQDGSSSTTLPQEAVYCLRSSKGFIDVGQRQEYTSYYDMLNPSDKSQLQSGLNESDGTYSNLVTHDGGNTYNKILALLDSFYVPGISSAQYKQTLNDKAAEKVRDSEFFEHQLSEDDIEAVQQAALWYFTNYKIYNEDKFDQDTKYPSGGWLYYTKSEGAEANGYSSFADYKPAGREASQGEGYQRQKLAEALYTYLIEQAEANYSKYANGAQTSAPLTITGNEPLNCQKTADGYVIGPITTTATGDVADASISLTFEPTVSSYKVLKGEEKTDSTLDAMKTSGTYYISIPNSANVNPGELKLKFNVSYTAQKKFTIWTNNSVNTEQPVVVIEKTPGSQETELKTTIPEPEKIRDLALRKYITGIEQGSSFTQGPRAPEITNTDVLKGEDASNHTARYCHRKDPVSVQENDIVTYTIKIYNEGNVAGRAKQVIDQLPTGLEYVESSVTGDYTAEYDSATNKITFTKSSDDNLDAYSGTGDPSSNTITIKCKVTATQQEQKQVLTNIAYISDDEFAEDGTDIDSQPETSPSQTKEQLVNEDENNYKGNTSNPNVSAANNYWKGQQDDDDFEKVVIPGTEPETPKEFDLKLVKKISAINGDEVEERLRGIDVSHLNIEGESSATTANYDLNKDPLHVKVGDIVTYTFMIFNEGEVDGYASEITEDIPKGLEFLYDAQGRSAEDIQSDPSLTDDEKEAIIFNLERSWTYDEETNTIKTDHLSMEKDIDNLIHAFGKNDGTKTEEDLDYKEVQVMFRVTSEAEGIVRNEAEISEDTDSEGKEVKDRDSDTEDWVKYEDDEDYDNVILESFDLALRKFIVAVTDNADASSIEDKTLESSLMKGEDGLYERAPVVDTSKLNTVDEDGNMITTAEYNHTKEPLTVTVGDYVYYMLRVYNEGDVDGYAAEVKDHLPKYLEFVDCDFNDYYGWELVDDEENTVKTTYLADQLIKKAEKIEDSDESETAGEGYELSYKEVPIVCRVSNATQTDYKVTNIADITEYQDENKQPADDRDSTQDNVDPQTEENKPSYKDNETGSYIPGQEDDDDFEKVVVRIFDLSLQKWVSEVIVTEDGKTTTTPTGHQPNGPEQTVKVDLNRKKLNSTTVKFRYGIRVTNEGGIPGYAKEITDYIPEGLEMLEEDNPNWTYEGNNIATTRQLENTLLQPGEYADISIVLKWINNANGNMGLKDNNAEISEDYNEYGVPDVDSTPGNKVPGEDDIDNAPVILSITTGRVPLYIGLTLISLTALAGGVYAIKKYVL